MPIKRFAAAVLLMTFMSASAHAADVVSPGKRQAYCRGEVAEQFGGTPANVKTDKPTTAEDGTTSVSGSVDLGKYGTKQFRCTFDAEGKFLDLVDVTEGDL
jgi:cytochrome c556